MLEWLFRWIARLWPLDRGRDLGRARLPRTEPLPAGSWCLVGNVGGTRESPPPDAASRGTKHFSFGTKLYCLPPQWGGGYERLVAIGQRSGSHRLIETVMFSKLVTNSIDRQDHGSWRAMDARREAWREGEARSSFAGRSRGHRLVPPQAT